MEFVKGAKWTGRRKLCMRLRSPSVWRFGTVATKSVSRAKASDV